MGSKVLAEQERAELEKVFELIQKGNEQEDAASTDDVVVGGGDISLLWDAASNFDEARRKLKGLSRIEHPSMEAAQEHQQILSLYKQQSIEYFRRARDCLINAMKKENENDTHQQAQDIDPLQIEESFFYHNLSNDECIKRLELFGRLFAKEPLDLPITAEIVSTQDEEIPMDEQASSIADRLQQLNKSLPSGFKTDEERMKDINRGLNRLGLSLFSASDNNSKPFGGAFAVEPHQSPEEQVADIIAQAKDEIAFMGTSTTTEPGEATGGAAASKTERQNELPFNELHNEDESTSDGELNEDNDEEADLTAEMCKDMQDQLAEAQALLCELIAMFDVDEGGDAPIQFDQASGKMALKKARIRLLQVTKKWHES